MFSMMDSRKGHIESFTPMLAVKTTSRKPSFGSDFDNEKRIAMVTFKAFIWTKDVQKVVLKTNLRNEFEL